MNIHRGKNLILYTGQYSKTNNTFYSGNVTISGDVLTPATGFSAPATPFECEFTVGGQNAKFTVTSKTSTTMTITPVPWQGTQYVVMSAVTIIDTLEELATSDNCELYVERELTEIASSDADSGFRSYLCGIAGGTCVAAGMSSTDDDGNNVVQQLYALFLAGRSVQSGHWFRMESEDGNFAWIFRAHIENMRHAGEVSGYSRYDISLRITGKIELIAI